MSRRTRGSAESDEPHPIDVRAGRNLKIARLLAGYSQHRLGDAVGLSFQQIQKYESGGNRLSMSRAHEFATILGIGIADYFDDADWLASDALLGSPSFGNWISLYARAERTGRASELAELTQQIVALFETSTGVTQCQ
jgi:transcriptional regulator with XRE-family HTH domain